MPCGYKSPMPIKPFYLHTTLRRRPWWQVPFIRLANWWERGHTAAKFGDHVIPGTGRPICRCCGEPLGSRYCMCEVPW
jgi:hypothetical protein